MAVVCVRVLWDGVCGVRLGGRLVAVGEAVIALACLRGRGDAGGGVGDGGGGGGWMVERGALWEKVLCVCLGWWQHTGAPCGLWDKAPSASGGDCGLEYRLGN